MASFYENKLKLGFDTLGGNTVDNIRGNASGSLFFNVEKREEHLGYQAQIGANSGDSFTLDIFHTGENLLRINTTRINTQDNAEKSLERLDYAMNVLGNQRGRLGAYQKRLEHIVNNLENTTENLQASESRIRDSTWPRK